MSFKQNMHFYLDQKISLKEFEEKRDIVFSKNTCVTDAL